MASALCVVLVDAFAVNNQQESPPQGYAELTAFLGEAQIRMNTHAIRVGDMQERAALVKEEKVRVEIDHRATKLSNRISKMMTQLHYITTEPVKKPSNKYLRASNPGASLVLTREWLEKAMAMVQEIENFPNPHCTNHKAITKVLNDGDEDVEKGLVKMEALLYVYEKYYEKGGHTFWRKATEMGLLPDDEEDHKEATKEKVKEASAKENEAAKKEDAAKQDHKEATIEKVEETTAKAKEIAQKAKSVASGDHHEANKHLKEAKGHHVEAA